MRRGVVGNFRAAGPGAGMTTTALEVVGIGAEATGVRAQAVPSAELMEMNARAAGELRG
jgi:hypothetical protein